MAPDHGGRSPPPARRLRAVVAGAVGAAGLERGAAGRAGLGGAGIRPLGLASARLYAPGAGRGEGACARAGRAGHRHSDRMATGSVTIRRSIVVTATGCFGEPVKKLEQNGAILASEEDGRLERRRWIGAFFLAILISRPVPRPGGFGWLTGWTSGFGTKLGRLNRASEKSV